MNRIKKLLLVPLYLSLKRLLITPNAKLMSPLSLLNQIKNTNNQQVGGLIFIPWQDVSLKIKTVY